MVGVPAIGPILMENMHKGRSGKAAELAGFSLKIKSGAQRGVVKSSSN